MQEAEPPVSSSTNAGGRSWSGLRRWGYFLLAAVLAVTASVVAFQQPPRPDPLSAPTLFSWAWWQYPIETNAIRRLTLISSNIRDITLVPNTHTLWIVGTDGLLASSGDGGQTWEKREISGVSPTMPVASPLPSLDNAPPPAPSPSPSPTHPIPPRSKAVLEDKNDFRNVDFRAEETKTPAQRDAKAPVQQGPRMMEPSPSPSPTAPPPTAQSASVPDLVAISFDDKEHGCAVGLRGSVAFTTDSGETWHTGSANVVSDFLGVQIDGSGGIALGANGEHFTTGNSGARWLVDFMIPPVHILESVLIVDDDEAWSRGSDFVLYHTKANWNWRWQATEEVPPVFIPLGNSLGHIGWVGSRERAVKIRTLNRRPAFPPPIPDPRVNVILLSSNDHDAWAVGDEGIIFATSDGGKLWRMLALTPSADLEDRRQGAGSHHRFPAPWYYAACALSLGLCVPLLRRPPAVTQQSSVADILASDRPIEPGEPDPLQFNSVALGLSRFLRNANTTPPLSIAITGEWGTGKSSLMNLLRGDLRARGFRPVWFNPWHHQKEEHLLAALLENIQAQAIPALFSFQGLCYRLPLLWFRARRFWRISLFLSILLALSAGYFAVEPGPRMDAAGKQLSELAADTTAFIGNLVRKPKEPAPNKPESPAERKPDSVSAPKPEEDNHAPAAIFFITSLIGSIVAVTRALRSFGVDPASLLATTAARPRLRDLKAETSFRYKFARQFTDVTRALRALNYRTMLILIDDLDRCRPESVVEMLEAVNFLITCGECFIVIGMARERVERCVGLAFKDMAEEVFGNSGGSPEQKDEAQKQRRAEFAKQYLEKLINIEVPVPEATPEQSRHLLGRDEALAGAHRGWKSPRGQTMTRAVGITATVLLLLVAAFVGGKLIFPKRTPGPGLKVSNTQRYQSEPPSTVSSRNFFDNPESESESEGATLESATPGETTSWVFWPLIAALVAAGSWSTLMLPANVVYDSTKFIEALRRWQPVISRKRNTPRSLKRFLNRVRYLAMRQRPAEPERTKWDSLRSNFLGSSRLKGEASSDGIIDEDILVGLSACKYLFPERSIGIAIDLAKEELTSYTREVPAEIELRDYLSGPFRRQAEDSSEAFEKLHAGLHVY